MYEAFFNLNSKPFAMNPDPSFLYPSRQHMAALTMLEYAIEAQAAFCLLTGDIGSGKTTLVRKLIRSLDERFAVGLISNTHDRFPSIIPWALSSLGVVPADDTEIAHYEALTDSVIRDYGKGRRTLLIFDEAQNISVQALEELRLLSNLNSEKDIALQILLVGQPELRSKLGRPELTQFAQRVAVDFHLECLALTESRAYVMHRLRVAGCKTMIFHPEAVAYIHARARGVPRLMNQLCDLALVYAYAERRRTIDEQLVRLVLQERHRGRAMPIFSADPAAVPLSPKSSAIDEGAASKRI